MARTLKDLHALPSFALAGTFYRADGADAFQRLSEQYCDLRDRSGEGASTFPSVNIKKDRKIIAHISYNGRVWKGSVHEQTGILLYDNSAPVAATPAIASTIHAVLAAQIVISAWANYTDEAEAESDAILFAAVGYASAILQNAPHQIPETMRHHFAVAIAIITDTRLAGDVAPPDLTFAEAIEPLEEFVKRMSGSRPLGEILGATENVGSLPNPREVPTRSLREIFEDGDATHRFPGARR